MFLILQVSPSFWISCLHFDPLRGVNFPHSQLKKSYFLVKSAKIAIFEQRFLIISKYGAHLTPPVPKNIFVYIFFETKFIEFLFPDAA